MTERKSAGESWEHVPLSKPNNVIEALARVMADLPAIGKDTKSENLPYKYRSIEDMTGAVQPLFGKYGVVMVPSVLRWETRDLVINNKPWTDTVLEVVYTVYGPAGQDDKIMVGPLVSIGRDNSDKGPNKALTQAFKYALIQALCISDSRDDGDKENVEADPLPRPSAEAEEAMHELTLLIEDFPETERKLLRTYLRNRFGPPSHMELDAIHEAQKVAAGWPDTAVP